MKTNQPNNVISLASKIADKKSTSPLEKAPHLKSNTRIIAITSGKGGVGKTSIVANLGYAFSQLGKRVLILDADLGLGNMDILLGLAPKYNLSHVISGEKQLSEITLEGPAKIKIIPASSGIQELTKLTKIQSDHILAQIESLIESVDILLIDTAAGISSNVMYFNSSAQEIIVVVVPEPTSITDAYAMMKVLSLNYSEKHFKLLVNQAENSREAYDVFRQLSIVSDRFLDISIEYIGNILFDDKVAEGVRLQQVVTQAFPNSQASRCFTSLAKKIDKLPPSPISGGRYQSLF